MQHLLLLFAAHFLNDAALSVLPPLLPLLVEGRGLSVPLAASLVSIQSIVSGLAQPALGHVADVVRRPWVLPAVLLLCGAGTAGLGLAATYPALAAAVAAAAAASGLFHPLSASLVRALAPERAALAQSMHTFIGTAGVALAPVIAIVLMNGPFAEGLGLLGGLLGLLAAAVVLTGTHRLDPQAAAPAAVRRAHPADEPAPRVARSQAVNLALLASGLFPRVQAGAALQVFLPLYYAGRPEGAALGNLMLTLYLVASAAATLLFGYLSDRAGRRRVTLLTQIAAPLPLLAFLAAPPAWAPVFLALAAAALSATTAAGVVYAQELMPHRPALAASVIIGFIHGLAGVVVTPLGALGERVGLGAVLQALALLPLAGVPFLLRLPETRPPRAEVAPRAAES